MLQKYNQSPKQAYMKVEFINYSGKSGQCPFVDWPVSLNVDFRD